MRLLYWLCVLFTLPLLAAIGHDIYYAYKSPQGLSLQQPFQFSDLGWLWLHYAHGSYHWARATIPPAVWKKIIGPVLEQKSIVATAVPALVCYVLFFTARFFLPFLGRLRLAPRRAPAPGNRAALRKNARSMDNDELKRKSVKYNRK